jgi:TldD protein
MDGALRDLVNRALDAATGSGAGFADIRVVEHETEGLTVKNGSLASVANDRSAGFGVRALVDGAWGFASSPDLEPAEAERVARRAVAIARASREAGGAPVVLDDSPPEHGSFRTPVVEDPFAVSLEEKLRLMFGADEAMGNARGISLREVRLEATRDQKRYASSEGAFVEQDLFSCGAGMIATAVNDQESQERSYPKSLGGQIEGRGFEAIREMALPEHGQQIAEEAVALLDAPQCPSGEMDIILDASQVAIQVHESCGHPSELDRVLGMEASFAGTSFLTTDRLDRLQYGSPVVNIDADATASGGLGTFGWDDEGVPAQNVPLVSEGRFVGYLTSRETAPVVGRRSMGSSRSATWRNLPIIRMTNINLRPGEAGTLEDLIADTKDGILFGTNRSWSIDERRLNFQFGSEIGWLIRNGQRAGIVRNPTYTGITPRFWGSCDAICGPSEWTLWGEPYCGKGEPMQTAAVGHGAAPARFRGVQVGVGRW